MGEQIELISLGKVTIKVSNAPCAARAHGMNQHGTGNRRATTQFSRHDVV